MKPFAKLTCLLLVELLALAPLAAPYLVAEAAVSNTAPPEGGCEVRATEFTGASTEEELLEGKQVDPPVEETTPEEGAPDPGSSETADAPQSQSRRFAAVEEDTEGEGEELPYQSVNLEELKRNPFFSQEDFDAFVAANRGWYDTQTGLWNFCSLVGMDRLNSVVPVNLGLDTYLRKLLYPKDQLVFRNPVDKYALTGEPCTLFDPRTQKCDETKEEVTVTDLNGQPILDTNGQPLKEVRPKYYDDSIWPNGLWDAPKADLRILKTLTYLITPTGRGGAGRERIKVAKILQMGTRNGEFPEEGDDVTAEPDDSSAESPHAYDTTNPGSPSKIAQAVDISEIDKLRITTKIVQRRRLGGNTTSYQYKELPLKVAWQTDEGVLSAPLVGPNMYQAALSSFSLNLAELLDSMGLEAELDLTAMNDVSSFGDIAELIGVAIFTQLLNSPNGSLQGWDFASFLDSIGRAYLAAELGLPASAFSKGTTVDELIVNVGQARVEEIFGFPTGSLSGTTPQEIFASAGRRELEITLGVKEGTLLPLGTLSQGELLERIGAGRLEQRFKLPQGSMRTESWDQARSSAKAKLLFVKSSASFLDEALSLAFQEEGGTGANSFGFHAGDYDAPTARFLENPSNAAFARWKQLIGARAIETSIGKFTPATMRFEDTNAETERQDFIATIREHSGMRFFAPGDPLVIQGSHLLFDAVIPGYGSQPWRVTIPENSPLLTTGAFTLEELQQLAAKTVDAFVRKTFGTPPCEPGIVGCNPNQNSSAVNSVEEARALYNQLIEYWRPTFQTAYTRLSELLRQNSANHTQSEVQLLTTTLQKVSVVTGQIKSYAEGLLNRINGTGQSGQSAALNLPGSFTGSNPNGTLTTEVYFNGDPMRAVLSGNLAPELFALLGRRFVANKLTNDPSAVMALQNVLNSDLEKFDTLTRYGVSVEQWIANGLHAEDFDRIFTKGLSQQVFRRVGEQELLRILWVKSGLQHSVQQAAGSEQVQELMVLAQQVAQGLQFYQTRIRELRQIAETIRQSDAQLDPAARQLLERISTSPEPTTIADAQERGRQYEAALGTVVTSSATILALVARAEHIMRELAAGHELGFGQSPDGTPGSSQGVSYNGCWTVEELRSFLGNKDNLVTGLATRTAACRVDEALTFPYGTSYAWYSTNDFTYDSLALTIGRTYARNTGRQLTDEQALAYGKKFLETAAIDRLLAGVPAVSSALRRYGLTGADVATMLNGGTELVLRKVGAKMLDGFFNWSPGTAGQIILPTCVDENRNPRPCSKEEAYNIRVAAMASIGLKELGLTLGFPTTFSIFPSSETLGNGSFALSYGVALLSEAFGMQQNTFYGTAEELKAKSDARTLLKSLGWYDSPATRALRKLGADIRQLGVGLSPGTYRDLSALGVVAEDASRDLERLTLDQLVGANAPVWIDGNEAAVGEAIATLHRDAYIRALDSITISAQALDPVTLGKVTTLLERATGADLGSAQTYTNQVLAYKARVTALDRQYGVEAGTFRRYLSGTGTGEQIAETIARRDLIKTFGDSTLKALLEGTPFAEVPAAFRVLTTTSQCPDGMTLGDFLVDRSQNTSGPCTISSVSLKELFSSQTIEMKRKRLWLYQHLLARSWGMQLEKDLKLQPGVFVQLALEPYRAREIMIDQGIRLLGEQLFKLADIGGADANSRLLRIFHSSLMAGFCPVDPLTIENPVDREILREQTYRCTLKFDSFRSVAILKQELNQMLRDRFNDYSYNRETIGLVDIAIVLVGGMSGALFLGAQILAKSVNEKLASDPESQAFRLQYNDVRNAFGQFTLSQKERDAFILTAQTDFIRSYYDCNGSNPDPACGRNNQDLVRYFLATEDGVLSLEERASTLADIAADAGESGPELMRRRALAAMQYNLYDIFAHNADGSIPRGFAYAMLEGTPSEKYHYLALYLANKLNLGESVFGGILTNEMAVSLVEYVRRGYTGSISLDALGALDRWLSQESVNLFGIALPAGTVQGIFAWGTTGFDRRFFDSSQTFNVGGRQFSPVGTILKNWGVGKLLSWADQSFGFAPGSALQIYQAVTDIAKASAYLKMAKVSKDVAAAVFVAGDPMQAKAVKNVADARANLRAAQVALVTILVTTIFASQISQAEEQLGLVPGTGALAVTMLVQFAMGVPIDPITLALFVGINLFGVFKVDIYVRATVDGYYPYTGEYGVARFKPFEYLSPDPPTGTFDAKAATSYRTGLKEGVRFKINQLLQDLLLMPQRFAAVTGDDPNNLWISQVFTGRQEDVASLDSLISRPAPWNEPSGLGYGALEDRATIFLNPKTGVYEAKPNAGYNAGYFASPSFSGHIHLRW